MRRRPPTGPRTGLLWTRSSSEPCCCSCAGLGTKSCRILCVRKRGTPDSCVCWLDCLFKHPACRHADPPSRGRHELAMANGQGMGGTGGCHVHGRVLAALVAAALTAALTAADVLTINATAPPLPPQLQPFGGAWLIANPLQTGLGCAAPGGNDCPPGQPCEPRDNGSCCGGISCQDGVGDCCCPRAPP